MAKARVLGIGACLLALVIGMSGCGGATQSRLYEIGPTLKGYSYQTAHIRHARVEDDTTEAIRAAFEAELADELVERGFSVSTNPDGALEIVYRAVSFKAGNTAGRLASAVAGFVSPVGNLGQEVGSGEVAVKVEFFAPDGTRIADTVIQQQIAGITGHSELTIRKIAGTVAKFSAARFSGDPTRVEFDDDPLWTGGLPLYRAIEGEWRYAAMTLEGETLATGVLDYELHHQGRVVVTTATVDGETENPTDAVAVLFQLHTGRVVRWWLDPDTGTWRDTSIRLTANEDGFEYRTESEDGSVLEGRVIAAVNNPLGVIELTRIAPDGTESWLEIRMERLH